MLQVFSPIKMAKKAVSRLGKGIVAFSTALQLDKKFDKDDPCHATFRGAQAILAIHNIAKETHQILKKMTEKGGNKLWEKAGKVVSMGGVLVHPMFGLALDIFVGVFHPEPDEERLERKLNELHGDMNRGFRNISKQITAFRDETKRRFHQLSVEISNQADRILRGVREITLLDREKGVLVKCRSWYDVLLRNTRLISIRIESLVDGLWDSFDRSLVECQRYLKEYLDNMYLLSQLSVLLDQLEDHYVATGADSDGAPMLARCFYETIVMAVNMVRLSQQHEVILTYFYLISGGVVARYSDNDENALTSSFSSYYRKCKGN
eukprot:601561_1